MSKQNSVKQTRNDTIPTFQRIQKRGMKVVRGKQYYWKFLRFYLIYLGFFISLVYTLGSKHENTYEAIGTFFYLFMLQFGLHLVSFIYGLNFQLRNRINMLNLFVMTGILFVLGAVAFSVWYPPLHFLYNYHSTNLKNLTNLAIGQALSFLSGSLLISGIHYLKNSRDSK
jgi:heme/copper-type cytochrome/quinol oxidase subunit 4